MGEFKYKFENRDAETQGYDGFSEDQKDLSDHYPQLHKYQGY